MDGENPYDDAVVIIGFLRTLKPKLQEDDSIPIGNIKSWTDPETDTEDLLDYIHKSEIHVSYYSDECRRVTSEDPKEIEKDIERLERDPPWYD